MKKILPILIVAFAIVVAVVLFKTKGKADRSQVRAVVPVVEAIEAAPELMAALVTGTGLVRPEEEISLIPEVAGRVTKCSERLLPGGRFQKGDVLFWIDSRDYKAAVSQKESNLGQAKLALELERGRNQTALREWELLGKSEADSMLAKREPHLLNAEAAYSAAEASLEQAKRSVNKTSVRAPFDLVVITESVDVGQVVGGQPVAVLYGTKRALVSVAVPVQTLSTIDIPNVNSDRGSDVLVTQRLGDKSVERSAQVIGLEGQLDPKALTARLLVAIPDPLELRDGLPLLPGAWVDIQITGHQELVQAVPEQFIFDGSTLWQVKDTGELRETNPPAPPKAKGIKRLMAKIKGKETAEAKTLTQEISQLWPKEVETLWRADGMSYVSGLEAGDLLLGTNLAFTVEGLEVEVKGD